MLIIISLNTAFIITLQCNRNALMPEELISNVTGPRRASDILNCTIHTTKAYPSFQQFSSSF